MDFLYSNLKLAILSCKSISSTQYILFINYCNKKTQQFNKAGRYEILQYM